MPDATPNSLGTFIDQDGGVWPVVGYYDINVEQTDDPDEIVWAMAGVEGHWMMIKLDEVDEVTIQ